MSAAPADLRYTASHEWVRVHADGTATVGITDHAQEALGDIVYVETPELGRQVDAGDACAVVESVKAASDIYAPLAGEVVGVNGALADTPESINQSAYEDGWIFTLRLADPDAAGGLLDAAGYAAAVHAEA
ncbi:MAG TPA: glycine cleavage system protein GcvH [Lamprocystis sp. (in: g-proteobacteria)]|nr:glycine cleavage system protein GcvH [Lamprocystis sp. (in: g-proteobacteria)]